MRGGEQVLLHACHKNGIELHALGSMHRHKRHLRRPVVVPVGICHERYF